MNIGSGIVLDLEPTVCALCGTNGATGSPIFEGYDIEFRTCDNAFRFIECGTCGHIYLSPRPKEEDIKSTDRF